MRPERLLSCLAIIGIMSSGATGAQRQAAPAPERLSFEAASIKSNRTGPLFDARDNPPYQPGRFIVTYQPLRSLISNAYRLDVIGGPAWLDTEHYDITAKAAGDPSVDQLRAMVRTLLADRFQLRAHIEPRQNDVMLLTLARSDGRPGPKLEPNRNCSTLARETATPLSSLNSARGAASSAAANTEPCGRISVAIGHMIAHGVELSGIAKLGLRTPAGRPVVDRTGLTGTFNADLEWAPDSSDPAATPDGPGFVTALEEQLGLKLTRGRAPQDVLIIDSVKRPAED